MKKNILFLLTLALGAVFFCGCSEDDLRDKSSIHDTTTEKNELDLWLDANYLNTYNINFQYRIKDIWSDLDYNLAPASYENSIRMAKLTLHLCLNAYDEVTGNREFMRTYFPKIVHLIGSPAVNMNNTIVLGTAEGGKMMTLYMINNLPQWMPTSENPDQKVEMDLLNEYFFHTMHHEFAHILHQTIPYSNDFNSISGAGYIGDNWSSAYNNQTAQQNGFITAYASKAVDEDFVECYATYITTTASDWNSMISAAGNGGSIISRKMDVVREYMKTTFGIDVDQMRKVVLRRQGEILSLDLDNL